MRDGGDGPHLFLGRRVPPSFGIRAVTIRPGGTHAYDAAEWRGEIVSVEEGSVELESADGERHAFGPGSLLWLDGVRLAVIRNIGCTPAVLLAIRRPACAGP